MQSKYVVKHSPAHCDSLENGWMTSHTLNKKEKAHNSLWLDTEYVMLVRPAPKRPKWKLLPGSYNEGTHLKIVSTNRHNDTYLLIGGNYQDLDAESILRTLNKEE